MSRRNTSLADRFLMESETSLDHDDSVAFLRGVGRALVEERKRCGLSQQQVAEQIGVEPETVSRIENGGIAPSLVRLRQFAYVYGCSLQGLLGRTSDRLPDLAQRIASELDGLPARDQLHVAEQALATARYLQGLRRKRGSP